MDKVCQTQSRMAQEALSADLAARPKKDPTGLWAQISDDPKDIKAMAKAAATPELIVVSDWSRYTSEEYWKANEESGLQIL